MKDYFCEDCNRVIHPWELQTNTCKNGISRYWTHKECGSKRIIRKEHIVKEEINNVTDLFE